MEVYKSKYLELHYYQDEDYLLAIWIETNEEMTDVAYQNEMLQQLEVIKKYKISGLLPDARNLQFMITHEMQDWLDENIFIPAFQAGLTKVAILVSKEFYTSLSIELTMSEQQGQQFNTKYFNTREDAKNWLLS